MSCSSLFLQFFFFLATYFSHVLFDFLKNQLVESAHWPSTSDDFVGLGVASAFVGLGVGSGVVGLGEGLGVGFDVVGLGEGVGVVGSGVGLGVGFGVVGLGVGMGVGFRVGSGEGAGVIEIWKRSESVREASSEQVSVIVYALTSTSPETTFI